jgi:hypothetical protein
MDHDFWGFLQRARPQRFATLSVAQAPEVLAAT